MVNRTTLMAFFLALSAPIWAAGTAILEPAKPVNYDGARMRDEAAAINQAAAKALTKGGLFVENHRVNPTLNANVPAPSLESDSANSSDKPGFLSRLLRSTGKMSLGGAAAGVAIGGLAGGLLGAVIGGAIGAGIGFFMSKLMAK